MAELKGMKMEVTIGNYTSTGNKMIHGGRIYAGPTTGIPISATINELEAAGLPTQQQVNMQGQLSSLYLNVGQVLKASGVPLSVNRVSPYPPDFAQCVFVIVSGDNLANNDHIA